MSKSSVKDSPKRKIKVREKATKAHGRAANKIGSKETVKDVVDHATTGHVKSSKTPFMGVSSEKGDPRFKAPHHGKQFKAPKK